MGVLRDITMRTRLERFWPDACNWQCRLLARAVCQEWRTTRKLRGMRKEDARGLRTEGVDGIRKLRFGPQNYNENVAAVLNRLSSLEWDGALPKTMDVVVSLPFDAPALTGRLNGLDSEVQEVLEAGW
jgi:hypothetical protein